VLQDSPPDLTFVTPCPPPADAKGKSKTALETWIWQQSLDFGIGKVPVETRYDVAIGALPTAPLHGAVNPRM
jgi:hypothetical protein